MSFEPVDRLPRVEWAPYWKPTIDRWITEGMPHDASTADRLRDTLGLDCWRQYWARPRSESCPTPPSHGASIINDAAGYESILDALYPIRDLTVPLSGWVEPHRRGDMVVWLTLEGFFWYPRTLFGIENHLYAFYDQPELMHRMNRDLLRWNLKVVDQFCDIVRPEFVTIAEDMSYNKGPMLSSDLWQEFLAPYYVELVAELRARDIFVFVDSDGDVTELIPWIKQSGVQGILPLERMAGVDISAIRADHPEFLLLGAFDKTVMHRGEAAMRAEFERLLPVMRGGGFVPSVDHQTPPDVSWHDYQHYLSLLAEFSTAATRPG